MTIPALCFAQGPPNLVQLPQTCCEAAAEARAALRRFREANRPIHESDAVDDPSKMSRRTPWRLSVQLPLPCPGFTDDLVRPYDEADWPGGIQQRFRVLRPLVEDNFLSGYNAIFIGMLESPADGIGVWDMGTATIVTNVTNATFAPFARLCAGDFGSRVLEPDHLLIAVNSSWTSSKDIGQLWDWKLREQAATLIDDLSQWEQLWHLEDVRTAAGATGVLFRSYPEQWMLFATETDSRWSLFSERSNPPPVTGKVLLQSFERPSMEEIRRLLNEQRSSRQNKARLHRKKSE
jgi:hypothetical protein